MLATIKDDKMADWALYVASLVQAYNSTKSDDPDFLLFGYFLYMHFKN